MFIHLDSRARHALAFRYYGAESRIVLYHLGGFATTGSFTDWNAGRRRTISAPQQMIVIAAAGPSSKFYGGVAVWSAVTMFHLELPITNTSKTMCHCRGSPVLRLCDCADVLSTFVWVSVVWAILNLLPILPLDGGQILRDVLRLRGRRDAINRTALVSMVLAGILALYCFQVGMQGSGLMCLFLLSSNWQIYQSTRFGEY